MGAKTVCLPAPGGPARARNVGANLARGEVIFFVDADVLLHPETIGAIGDWFDRQPELGALIGSYVDAPGAGNFLSQYKNLFHHYTHQVSSETASTFWGACGAIRRDAFLEVGGFDESYRKPSVEDIELGYRLVRAGHSIRLCKDVQVKHLKRWEFGSLLKAEVFYRAIPWTELILSYRHFDADLNLNRSSRVSVVCTFALVVVAIAGLLQPWLYLAAIGLVAILLAVNWDVYRFFYTKRGGMFALRVVPWHWFYFLYGGGAFAYSTARYYLQSQAVGQNLAFWKNAGRKRSDRVESSQVRSRGIQ